MRRKLFSVRRLALFTCGFLTLGASACVKLPHAGHVPVGQNAPQTASGGEPRPALVNINTASREELEKLPGIGRALAERIVEHRTRYGAFRRVEHLLVVRGISAQRFHQMRALIKAE